MRQRKAIDAVSASLKLDEAVLAIFLKGSIASDSHDEWSDVDLYCLVDENKIDAFLKRRILHLEKYKKIIYHSEANFVGPQVVAVFEDALHFDLYAVTKSKFPTTDKIKVLHDPDNFLVGYVAKPLAVSEEEVVRFFNEITFVFIEFEAAYLRKDYVWASRLAGHMLSDTAIIIRYFEDPSSAQLGLKKLKKYLNRDCYERLIKISNGISPANLPQGVFDLIDLLKELKVKISSGINHELFNLMSQRIIDLKK
jgi:predicted nucleotidyltransferase